MGEPRASLRHLEPQLAAIWIGWLRISRLLKIHRSTGIRNIQANFSLYRMFRNSKRFWATNDGRFLNTAVRHYLLLRDAWIVQSEKVEGSLNTVSGWADKECYSIIKGSVPSKRIRRKFRPDVWYLRGNESGLFSGFEVNISLSELESLKAKLRHLLGEFPASDRDSAHKDISADVRFRFESSAPITTSDSLDLVSTFLVSPREFTWLVEATADRAIAGRLLDQTLDNKSFDLNSDLMRCLAICQLVREPVPQRRTIGKWALAQISAPDWKNVETETSNSLSRRISPRYFTSAEATVTNGGLVFTNGRFINWDEAQRPSLDFVAGNYDHVVGTSANLNYCYVSCPEVSESIENGILLGSRVDYNWFHFLIETLPRLYLVDGLVEPAVPIIVSKRIPETARQVLGAITSRKVIEVDSASSVRISNAIVPGPVVYHPDSQFLWGDASLSNFNLDARTQLRRDVLNSVEPTAEARNLYWPRVSKYRLIANAKKVWRLLQRKNFERENPGELSFKEQVRSIHSASTLVATGGALMSNFIFAQPGARIIVLVSDLGKTYPVPSILASVANAEVRMVGGLALGVGALETFVQKTHASFKTRIQQLKTALKP
jgi:hypothetical protein